MEENPKSETAALKTEGKMLEVWRGMKNSDR